MRRLLMGLLLVMLAACGSEETGRVVQAEASGCDAARMSCRVTVEGSEVELTLGPGVKALQPFAARAVFEDGADIEQLLIDFQMVGMEMGINRYRLLRAEGAWHGKVTLPVCTASRSDWVAILEYRRDGTDYRIRFPFSAEH